MKEITPFHNFEKIKFKEEFIERYKSLTNWETFKKYSLSFPRKSIRINTLKTSIKELKNSLSDKWTLENVPWCKEGYFISGERRDVGNLPEHALGHFYVQEAASMLPPIVLNPKEGELVLDCCSAPGSKTTQIAQYMHNKGILIANDSDAKRIQALKINLNRCGVSNTLVTRISFEKLFQERYKISKSEKLTPKAKTSKQMNLLKERFDKIQVDAPCSGMGIIRKSPKVINMWNPQLVNRLSKLQKQLLSNAYQLLRPGGELVYSTCTPEPQEDEGVVTDLLENNDDAKIMKIGLPINRTKPFEEFQDKKNKINEVYSSETRHCLRIWPQDNNTEGFFVTKIKKEG